MKPAFRIEVLESQDRTSFASGQDALDRYLRTQASQDMRRRIATCFVAIDGSSGRVAGYYTLSASNVPVGHLPPALTKKLPRYDGVPAALIGRLAVDLAYRGRGLGGALVDNALRRVVASEVTAYALLVDAKDEAPASFYRHLGFEPLSEHPRRMFLPIDTALKLFDH